jgi:aminopeptidase N
VIRATAIGAAAVLFIPTAAMAASPGAPGIGDPYFPNYGNGGYDASHYDVAVTVDGATLTGTTTMTATATQDLSRFDLDFVLKTTSVTVNGEKAKIQHDSDNIHELVVTPAKTVHKGDKMTVVVKYSDQPGTVFDHGINPVYTTQPDNGMLVLGEPEAAPWWMATNDHPRDKATFDIKITVPNGWEGITSGRLVGSDFTDAKTDTWHWQVNQPTTGYLVPMAAGQYDLEKSTIDGLPSWTAIADDTGATGAAAAADFARMDEVADFLEGQFGKYHFDSHGNVMVNTSVGFALETQTRPVYSPGFWSGGRSNIGVVVHENAHQWFGDNVSVHNWRDVWMNEGFASWAQWRWDEAQGEATGNELLKSYYDFYGEGDSFWLLKIGDPGAADLFAGEVYDRGAMTVQALRNRIGNQNLLELFRQWQSKHEHDDASIKQFISLAEKISGKNLKSFFKAWLYTSERPAATKKNGLKGYVTDATADATNSQRVADAWNELRQTNAQIAAAEGFGRG